MNLLIEDVLTQRQSSCQQQQDAKRQHKPMQQAFVITQQKVIGNSNNRNPALVRGGIIHAALIAVIISYIRNITRIVIAYFLKNLLHIRLLLFYRQVAVIDRKHDIAIRVTQIIIAVRRQLVICQKRVKTLRINIHCQHIVIAKAYSQGQHASAAIIFAIKISISYAVFIF